MNAPMVRQDIDLRAVEAFLHHEARLLDERRFEEWMALFVEDGYYWAPARPGQTDPHNEVSLIFDTPDLMRNRIQRLRHPKIYAQIPFSRTVRQVTNIGIEEQDAAAGEITVRSVFFLFEHRPTLPEPLTRVFAGEYRHRLRSGTDGFRMAWKQAHLANCDAAFEALFIYF